ncbi:MAG: tRNA 2-thiouridine(34) synthase MnmA [Pseudomonadota bacterium]
MKNIDFQSLTGRGRLFPDGEVVLALSGGVDSAVAAFILKEQGLKVQAVHLVFHDKPDATASALDLARRLELDLRLLDIKEEFERLVVEPFARAYVQGRTPSPCVACNPLIKFGLLADLTGAEHLATGHYAGLAPSWPGPGFHLVRPRDRVKDQTYFLSRLTPNMLARAVFPLAGLTKDQVRAKAAALGLEEKPESQEICFLKGLDYRGFLRDRFGDDALTPGDFVDPSGKVVGRHEGIAAYTVGQRRGLGLPGVFPYYVLKLDPLKNQVVVGPRELTFSRRFLVRAPVWSQAIAGPEFRALAQIRSRHQPAPAVVTVRPDRDLDVCFDQPQPSIASGQAAAFYEGDRLLGGGWIENVISDTPPPEPVEKDARSWPGIRRDR